MFIAAVFSLLITFPQSLSAKPPSLKVYISTWDKSRVHGRLESLTDSTISVKARKGQVYTFAAAETKNLKIWKPGIVAPAALGGA